MKAYKNVVPSLKGVPISKGDIIVSHMKHRNLDSLWICQVVDIIDTPLGDMAYIWDYEVFDDGRIPPQGLIDDLSEVQLDKLKDELMFPGFYKSSSIGALKCYIVNELAPVVKMLKNDSARELGIKMLVQYIEEKLNLKLEYSPVIQID